MEDTTTTIKNKREKLFRKKILRHQKNSLFDTSGILLLFIDFMLVNIAYFGLHYYKRSTFALEPDYYFKLLLLFYAIWFGVSLVTKKFKISTYQNYKHTFIVLGRSTVFILYIVSLVILLSGLYAFSRIQIFGTCFMLFVLEYALFALYLKISHKFDPVSVGQIDPATEKFKNLSVKLLLSDFILITFSFYIMNFIKRDSFYLSTTYEQLLLIIFAVWLFASLFTRKFERRQFRNVYYAISPHVKSFIIMVATMAVLVFAFRLFYYSRLQIFGAFTLLLTLEIIFSYIYHIISKRNKSVGDIENYHEVKYLLKQEELPFELEKIREQKNREIISAHIKLKENYLKEYPGIFDFIYKNLNLNKIDETDVSVINTHTLYNIETMDDHSVSLFVNLHKLNDLRWLNRYFLEVHKKIYNGGYFIGCVETIATHKTRFYRKFSKFLAQILYPLNFFFARILPKLPGLQHIYFLFTRGKNRVFSKAEVFGRLYFCGFKIVQSEIIGDCLFYIAQRVKTPSLDRNPSYGPLIKLRRIGYNGEIMHVSKFRTMHPYSEYLQEYIHEQYSLSSNGKFANDFRLTGWGQVFRRLWIDELPQIINFFQGDVNLVGVRALSEHYFSLYPEDMQQLRIQFKPGLVPPYYADMPKTFDEIIESERQYLNDKQTHPFSTDVRYFFKAMYNIVIKRARSQ